MFRSPSLRLLPCLFVVLAMALSSCSREKPDALPKEKGGDVQAQNEPLQAPDDAKFLRVTVGVETADTNVRRKVLDSFHANLKKKFKGDLQDDWVRCVSCEELTPADELKYNFIEEHAANKAKFEQTLTETQKETSSSNVSMSFVSLPNAGPPDCSFAKCPPGGPCTCINYAACRSGCKKSGTATCCGIP